MIRKTFNTQWLAMFNPLFFSFVAGAACLRVWEIKEHGYLLSVDAISFGFLALFFGGFAIAMQLHSTTRRD